MTYMSDNILFLHICRTGGSTVKKVLKDHEDGGKEFRKTHMTMNEVLGNGIDISDKTTFSVVRHPYDRATSFYQKLWRGDKEEVLLDICRTQERIRPCYDFLYVNGNLMVDKVIKFEYLKEGLTDILGYEPDVPLINQRKVDRMTLSDRAKREIQDIYKKDFENFDYNP